MSNSTLYDQDFYAWTNEQAKLLRTGKLSEADIDHIAEGIESMGGTEKRELVSCLAVLLGHMLKWRFQPERGTKSWEATIKIQRRGLTRHLADNPSLKGELDEAIADAYGDAIVAAAGDTGLAKGIFPAACPWSFEQMMAEDFWPGSLKSPGGRTLRE